MLWYLWTGGVQCRLEDGQWFVLALAHTSCCSRIWPASCSVCHRQRLTVDYERILSNLHLDCGLRRFCWLIEHGFTSAPTQHRLYGRRFLQVWWPNQQCQSTQGGWLVIQTGLNLTMLTSPCYNNTTCMQILYKNWNYLPGNSLLSTSTPWTIQGLCISINCIWGTPLVVVKGSRNPSVRSRRYSSVF